MTRIPLILKKKFDRFCNTIEIQAHHSSLYMFDFDVTKIIQVWVRDYKGNYKILHKDPFIDFDEVPITISRYLSLNPDDLFILKGRDELLNSFTNLKNVKKVINT